MLRVENLVVRYGHNEAVRGISFEVGTGDVSVLIGSNGAGKSSSLNGICAVPKDRQGTITFDGTDITRWSTDRIARAGLIQVPEGRRIIGPLTVEENLKLGTAAMKPRNAWRGRLDDVYDLFPRLKERRHGYGGLLSGGEQQMLAFGRALMCDPRMLVLDEPSMGLAPVAVHAITDSIRTIADLGIPILLVEQNAEAAFAVASTVMVLEQGLIVLSGTAEVVKKSPLVRRAFLGVAENES